MEAGNAFLLLCNYRLGGGGSGKGLGKDNSNASCQAQGGSTVLLSVFYELNLRQLWRQEVGRDSLEARVGIAEVGGLAIFAFAS